MAINLEIDNADGVINSLHQLAVLEQSQGNYQSAREMFEEALAVENRFGNLLHIARTTAQLATLELRVGNQAMGYQLMQQALLMLHGLDAPELRTAIEDDLNNIAEKINRVSWLRRLINWWNGLR